MIYGIYSKKDNFIRYIGLTKKPLLERLKEHKKTPSNPAMRCFFEMVDDENICIKELNEFDTEAEAIAYHFNQTPCRLLNYRTGCSSLQRSQITNKPKKQNYNTLLKDISNTDGFSERCREVSQTLSNIRKRIKMKGKGIITTVDKEKTLHERDYTDFDYDTDFYISSFSLNRKAKPKSYDIQKVKNIPVLCFDVLNNEDVLNELKNYQFTLLEYNEKVRIVLKLETQLPEYAYKAVCDFMIKKFDLSNAQEILEPVSSNYIDKLENNGKLFSIFDYEEDVVFKMSMFELI